MIKQVEPPSATIFSAFGIQFIFSWGRQEGTLYIEEKKKKKKKKESEETERKKGRKLRERKRERKSVPLLFHSFRSPTPSIFPSGVCVSIYDVLCE